MHIRHTYTADIHIRHTYKAYIQCIEMAYAVSVIV